jgi:hypothetical protein
VHIGNGGFDQYFFNDGLELPRECLKALQKIGATRIEALLRKALEPFDGTDEYDPTEAVRENLDRLAQEFYAIEDEPPDQAVGFIRANVNDFGWQG